MITNPVGNYTVNHPREHTINKTEVSVIAWKHEDCDEGCDLCTTELVRYDISWKESKVAEFQIKKEHEWEVTHAISQVLEGLK